MLTVTDGNDNDDDDDDDNDNDNDNDNDDNDNDNNDDDWSYLHKYHHCCVDKFLCHACNHIESHLCIYPC